MVVLIALVTAFGVPATSVAPVARRGSVPQIKELRVLLDPPFITALSWTEVVVKDAVLLERISGMRTKTFDFAGDLVIPEAFDASKA